MKTTRFLALGLAALLGCGAVRAGETDQTSEFTVNGIKVIVRQRPSTETVAAGIFFLGGRANLAAANAGIERLLLDAATEETARFPPAEFRRERTRLGATIGLSTAKEMSVVSLACPRRAFDRGFELLSEAVLRPAFTPDVVERTRARVIGSLTGETANADESVERTIAAEVYRGHPYAPPDEGTVESLRALTIDDLRAHHQMLLQGARLLVVVVGRVDPADVRRKVRAAFGQVPVGDSLDVEVRPLAFNGPAVRRFPVNGSPIVRGVFAIPPADAPDLPSLHLAVAILNVRLFASLRQKHSLAYDAGASLPSGRAVYGTIRVQTDDPNQAAGLIVDELTRLAREAPTARELKAAVAQVWSMQYIEEQTNAAQAAALVRAELAGLGWRNQRMKFDDVTPEAVQAAARQWLRHLQWFVFAEPNASIDEARFTDPR